MARALRLSIAVVTLLWLLVLCRSIESPAYDVIHVESDFEIRYYGNATWMSATVDDLSFQKATVFGFHRLFQYTEGANLNCSRVAMTSPVVTSLVPGAGPLHSSAYAVQFYLPAKFQCCPPTPLPALNLEPYFWESHYVAVRKFSGFATDDSVLKEAAKFATILSSSRWANSTTDSEYTYSIAQYDPPFRFIGRLNELWVDVDASEFDGPGKATA